MTSEISFRTRGNTNALAVLFRFLIPFALLAHVPGSAPLMAKSSFAPIALPAPPDSLGMRWIEGKWFIEHKVEKQETFYSIARRYQISPGILMEINPRHGNALREGEVILVPRILPAAPAATGQSPARQGSSIPDQSGQSSRPQAVEPKSPAQSSHALDHKELGVSGSAPTESAIPSTGWVRVLPRSGEELNPFTARSQQAAPGTLIWVSHPLTGKKELFKVTGPPPPEEEDPGTYLYIMPSGARSLGALTSFFTGQFQKATAVK